MTFNSEIKLSVALMESQCQMFKTRPRFDGRVNGLTLFRTIETEKNEVRDTVNL